MLSPFSEDEGSKLNFPTITYTANVEITSSFDPDDKMSDILRHDCSFGNVDLDTEGAASDFSFIDRLIHFLHGEKITPENWASVELAILCQAGADTFDRGLTDSNGREDVILQAYKSLWMKSMSLHFPPQRSKKRCLFNSSVLRNLSMVQVSG